MEHLERRAAQTCERAGSDSGVAFYEGKAAGYALSAEILLRFMNELRSTGLVQPVGEPRPL